MKELELNEIRKINGGGVSPWLIVGIAALVTLAAGIVDGYVRPLKCYRK